MDSNRPKHTEPTSGNQKGAEDSKGPCSSESFTGHSDSASIEKPALNSVPLNLMEQIVDTDNLECAWARVRSNRGAPGPDGITIDEFPDHFRELWPVLRQQLLEGTYKPGPVRRKSIPKAQAKSLDKWTRRRLRACYWKQWYRVRTRIRMLLKLGVRRDEAFSHGSSGRGVWVMSKSAAMHVAISKDYLKQRGLVSLEEIWSKFASKKRTAVCGPACTVV